MTTHELTCTSDFWVATEMSGEDWGTMWHMAMTLVTVSIMSSWCNAHKIKRLLLFFTHWLRYDPPYNTFEAGEKGTRQMVFIRYPFVLTDKL